MKIIQHKVSLFAGICFLFSSFFDDFSVIQEEYLERLARTTPPFPSLA
jgi:hypothetical protein